MNRTKKIHGLGQRKALIEITTYLVNGHAHLIIINSELTVITLFELDSLCQLLHMCRTLIVATYISQVSLLISYGSCVSINNNYFLS